MDERSSRVWLETFVSKVNTVPHHIKDGMDPFMWVLVMSVADVSLYVSGLIILWGIESRSRA